MKEQEYCSCKVKCSICEHTWFAVYPNGVDKLECPVCGRMVEFEILLDLIAEQKNLQNATYSEEDLINFGKYLLSEMREKMLRSNPYTKTPYEERFRLVHDADLANWRHIKQQIKDN